MKLIKERVGPYLIGFSVGMLLFAYYTIKRYQATPQNAQNVKMQKYYLSHPMPKDRSGPLPFVKLMEAALLKNNTKIGIELEYKANWKMNPDAPSWLELSKVKEDGSLEKLESFDRDKLLSSRVFFSPLSIGEYRLRGSFYYCQEGREAQCSIQSQDQEWNVVDGAVDADVVIQVGF